MQSFRLDGVGVYNSKISAPNTPMSKDRKTNIFELELPLENGGTSHIDAESARITTNLFICAKPNQIRRTRFPFKCNYMYLTVFDEGLCNVLFSLPTFITIQEHSIYASFFEELYKYYVTPSTTSKIMQQSLVLKLIYMLCTENEVSLKNTAEKNSTIINEAINFIEKNLSSDLKLEKVAREVSMSPIYFHNCFKKATGKTLHTYIEDARIKAAVNLMLGTDMTLTEIACACGFSSQSYFSYAFKRKMNMTPRKYIEALNNDYEI